MDLDLPLLFFVATFSLLTALRSLRARRLGPVALGGAFFVASVASYPFVGAAAGPWLAGAWFVVVVLPNLLMRLVVVALHRQRYVLGERIALAAYLLQPTRVVREGLERLSVLSAIERGDTAHACAILRKAVADKGESAVDAQLELLRLEERWGELAEAVQAVTPEQVAKNPALVVAGMRAYAELGRRQDLVAWFHRYERHLAPAALGPLRSIALMQLFATTGRTRDLGRLLQTQLGQLSAELVELWSAVASAVAGKPGSRERLLKLTEARDGAVRRSARIYLERSASLAADELSAEALSSVARVAERIEQEDRYVVGDATRSRPWLTWSIALLLVAVYVLSELRGGSTDVEALFGLGALWPPAVIDDGELFRLVAPLVLHFGPLHLGMNTAALLVLAPFVERALGRARFAFVYLASGLVGTVLYVLWVHLKGVEPGLMVGASGCIMGMVGASAAVLLRGYRLERALVAKRRLFLMVGLVALQSVFDLLTPQVSFFAHSVGAITGFVLTSLLAHAVSRTEATSGSSARAPQP